MRHTWGPRTTNHTKWKKTILHALSGHATATAGLIYKYINKLSLSFSLSLYIYIISVSRLRLHSEACNALGASDGVIHSSISLEVVSLRATTPLRRMVHFLRSILLPSAAEAKENTAITDPSNRDTNTCVLQQCK